MENAKLSTQKPKIIPNSMKERSLARQKGKEITLNDFAQVVIKAFKRASLDRFPHAVAFQEAKKYGLTITCSGMTPEEFKVAAQKFIDSDEEMSDAESDRFEILVIKLKNSKISLDWVDDNVLEVL